MPDTDSGERMDGTMIAHTDERPATSDAHNLVAEGAAAPLAIVPGHRDDTAKVESPEDVPQSPVTDAPAPSIPGWPADRFHPVYGRRTFADPNAYAMVGGDNGPWRFKRASDADAARTETEAQLVLRANQRRMEETLEAEAVSLSVQAHEGGLGGFPQPGLVLPKQD